MSGRAWHEKRLGWLTAGAFCGPLILVSAFLVLLKGLERMHNPMIEHLLRGPSVGYTYYGLGIALGLVFVLLLPVKAWVRALIAIVYVPAMFSLLWIYLVIFICAAFGDCL